MRTFEKKNVATFSVFGILIITAVIALSFVVINYVNNEESKIVINSNDLIFSDDDSIIEIVNEGEITKKWDKNYYLTDENHNSTKIGKNPIIYDQSENTINLLGEVYRIYPDGTTLKHQNGILISNTKESSLYKLQDRNYVFVGNEVYSYEPGFEAKDFMKIRVAKNGNALLQSKGLNSKTINHVLLVSGELYFDVGSEILYYKGVEINLRKVIGSTNEYDGAPILYELTGIERPETSTANERIPDIEEYNIIAGTGGDAGDGGYGGDGGKGGKGGKGGSAGDGGKGGDAGVTRQDDNYFMSVDGIESGIKSIKIKYSVYDPTNKIGRIICQIAPDGSENYITYLLNKYDGSYTIQDLEYDSTYKLVISYYEYEIEENKEGNLVYVLGDFPVTKGKFVATTTKAYANAKTEKLVRDINNNINKVYINLNLQDYNLRIGSLDNESTSRVLLTIYENNGDKRHKTIAIDDTAFLASGQTIVLETDENDAAVEMTYIEGYSDAVDANKNYDLIEIYINNESKGYYQLINQKEVD